MVVLFCLVLAEMSGLDEKIKKLEEIHQNVMLFSSAISNQKEYNLNSINVELSSVNTSRTEEYSNKISIFSKFLDDGESMISSGEICVNSVAPVFIFVPLDNFYIRKISISGYLGKKCNSKGIVFEFYNHSIKSFQSVQYLIPYELSEEILLDFETEIYCNRIEVGILENWGAYHSSCLPKLTFFGPE